MHAAVSLAVALVLIQAVPLDEIVVTGSVEDARAAIAKGADVNERGKDGVTALMRAASAGRGDMVRLLVASKADVNGTTTGGVTALMMASLGGYPDAVPPLIAAKAETNAKDNQGRTALMAAASSSDQQTVDLLLDAGADPKMEDAGGSTPLTYAAAEGFAGAVEAMQKRGAKPGPAELLLASARCNTPIVQAFLKSGMDPNPKDMGTTPLVAAAGGGCAETVELLIAHGAALNATNSDGWTPLI